MSKHSGEQARRQSVTPSPFHLTYTGPTLRYYNCTFASSRGSPTAAKNTALERKMSKRRQRVASLLEAQGPFCYLCHWAFTPTERPTLDHVVPRSHGGGNRGNLLLAHPTCNASKGNRSPTRDELAILYRINEKIDPGLWSDRTGWFDGEEWTEAA